MSQKPIEHQQPSDTKNLQSVDALRGYAILLVISVHSTPYLKELVWPVKRLLEFGWYGVQLFFLASALTLLMSWERSSGSLVVKSRKFLLRRFFRIAPLYYLAIVFYWYFNQRQTAEFSFDLLFATIFFYNAWSPYLIPTTPGWMPVPGGWSIGVEFFFYFTFPFLATVSNTLSRSVFFFVFSLLLMVFASHFGTSLYPELNIEERSNFLYFWPPNQLVIFSLGFLLFQLTKQVKIYNLISRSNINTTLVSFILLIFIFLISINGTQKFINLNSLTPPSHFIISFAFLSWALFLVIRPNGLTLNKPIIDLGKVSFSAYVLHFAVLKVISFVLNLIWPLPFTGWFSPLYAVALIVVGTISTWALSRVTYYYIELPFIAFGKKITK